MLTVVEEATRSTKEGVKYFVEPSGGSLRRAISRRHHLVFGRRGSGKSSLLRKAAADLTVERAPIAWVDLEPFKGHPYPDLLLSVLIATFSSFKSWLDKAAIAPSSRTTFWRKLFGRAPSKPSYNKKECALLSKTFGRYVEELNKQLHSADDADLSFKATISATTASKKQVTADIKSGGFNVGANASEKQSRKNDAETEEKHKRSKIDFLRRNIMLYQELFERINAVSGVNSFLFLDDLYHIRKDFQPQVVDFFHAIGKGHGVWLKIGTIRHRSQWYVHGDPPIGMKLSDDADDIDLDLTLEKYSITKTFLVKILTNLSSSSGLRPNQYLTEGALDRLVLASGGVARDFLAIFRRAVDVSREKGGANTIWLNKSVN